jgi:hypothetical protein
MWRFLDHHSRKCVHYPRQIITWGIQKKHKYTLCSYHIWGTPMILRKYKTCIVSRASALAMMLFLFGCGEDPGMYQGETLTFETPVSSKAVKRNSNEKKTHELDLGADERVDFVGMFGVAPAGFVPAYPLFDYYLEPIPIEIPVSPFFSVIDFVHPFYAFADLDLWGDDEGGSFFEDDDCCSWTDDD